MGRGPGVGFAVLVATVIACSDGGGGNDAADDEPLLTIAEALGAEAGATVTVRGSFIATGDHVLLAEALAESFPPQPGGAVLVLEGIDVAEVAGTRTEGDTTWSERPRTFTGVIDGEVLVVRARPPSS